MINQFFSSFIHFMIKIMALTPPTRWIMTTWFSISLYFQLMIGSGLLLVLVGTSAAMWNIEQQKNSLINITHQQSLSFSKLISQASAPLIKTNDFQKINQLINNLASERTIQRFDFINADGIPVQGYQRQTESQQFKPSNFTNKHTPNQSGLTKEADKTIIWTPVLNDEVVTGWLRTTLDERMLEPTLNQVFIDNSIQAWFSIFVQLLIIFFLLFLPAINFKRAIKFSKRIHEGTSETIETNGGSLETTQLIEALNKSSLLFSKQKQEILNINQGLEEKVKERTADLIIAQQQTNDLIEFSPDAMIVTDTDGFITRVNYRTEQLFGFKRSELIGQPVIELLSEELSEDYIGKILSVVNMSPAERAMNTQVHEYVAHTKFDDEIPISVSFNAISSNDEQTVVSSIRDITLEKQAKQQLQDALEKARAADKVKTQFLTTMSHEMRTPMNGVLGMAGMLSQTGLSDTQNDYLNTILNTGESLLTIINDILDFSQLESGTAKLQTSKISLQDLTDNITNLTATQAKEKGLSVSTEFVENCPAFISSDASRIRQVLFHFINNAIKFTNSGSVTIKFTQLNTVKDSPNFTLKISVIDTGPGIPENQLKSIFESFTQGDATTTRDADGTGIGLAICDQTAKLLDGTISVDSIVGKGSHFSIEIPTIAVLENEVIKKLPTKPKKILAQLDGQVLLVEDNLINQKVAAAILKKMGLIVDIANDGIEGVDMWRNKTYDLVLMDCLMPNMDGFEATRTIRELEKERNNGIHTPISALTANALEDDKIRCKEAGMDEFISKPINHSALTEVLKKYIPAKV